MAIKAKGITTRILEVSETPVRIEGNGQRKILFWLPLGYGRERCSLTGPQRLLLDTCMSLTREILLLAPELGSKTQPTLKELSELEKEECGLHHSDSKT